MKKVLILGAGMVVNPIVQYLLNKSFLVTIASNTKDRSDQLLAGNPNGKSIFWLADDEQTLDKLIEEHDLVVSLLPYVFHVMVAKHCIKHKKNMVTTSYVKPEMKSLDQEAKQAGIIILNELGLDPGIDHMSAMQIIDKVHDQGGNIEEFYSICGALPAPEAANNPFGYKFSWSPRGVILASNNDARYLKHGKIVEIPTENLFKNPLKATIPNIGKLDIYPNRDSISYIDIYNIPETKTMFRGTFRYPGWCETLDAMKNLRLVSSNKISISNKTYADFVAQLLGTNNSTDIRKQVAKHLQIDENAHAIKAMQWLGLFDKTLIEGTAETAFDVTADLMIKKMDLSPKERDLVVLQHSFLVSNKQGKKEVIKSTLIDYGSLSTDTAIARTVALPAAIGVELILQDNIQLKGVHIPVKKEIYAPILKNLEYLGITMKEEYGLPVTEIVK